MSVTKFREFVEKSGCGLIVAIALAAVMLFGILQCNPSQAQQSQLDGAAGAGPELADIQGVALRSGYVNDFAARVRDQMQQGGQQITLENEANAEGHGLEQSVIACLLLVLCEREGVKLDQAALEGALNKQAEQVFESQRMQWITEGKLKATASKADFDTLYKTSYGKTPQEVLNENKANIGERLKSDNAFDLKVGFANTLLIEHYAKTLPAAEADVLASYDTYHTKRIQLKKSQRPGEDLVAKLNAIKKEIAAGLKFEDAMVKYSDEPAGTDPKDPKKKLPKSESVMQIDGTTIEIDSSYAPVARLKPGQISEPLGFADSVEIFRLDKVVNAAPADFKAKFETYKKQFVEPRAITKMQSGLKALQADKSLIKWISKGHGVLYDRHTFINDQANFALDPAAQRKKLEEILDRAQKIMGTDDLGARIAAIVSYVVMEDIYNRTEPKDRPAIEARREEILEKISNDMSDASVSAKLVTTLVARKEKEKLGPAIEKAISNLMGQVDEAGAKIFAEISTDIDTAVQQKLLTEDEAKVYRTSLNEWKVAKVERDKYEAEAKKAAEEQKKLDDAAKAKQEAEMKKEEEALKKQAEADAKKDAEKNKTPEKTKSGG